MKNEKIKDLIENSQTILSRPFVILGPRKPRPFSTVDSKVKEIIRFKTKRQRRQEERWTKGKKYLCGVRSDEVSV